MSLLLKGGLAATLVGTILITTGCPGGNGVAGAPPELCDSSCWLPHPSACVEPQQSGTVDVTLYCYTNWTAGQDCEYDLRLLRIVDGGPVGDFELDPGDEHVVVPYNSWQTFTLGFTSTSSADVGAANIVSSLTNESCSIGTCPVDIAQVNIQSRASHLDVPCP